MARKNEGFTITWRIQNYDLFYEKRGNVIESLPFVIDSMKSTSWELMIGAESQFMNRYIGFRISMLTNTAELDLNLETSFFSNSNSSPSFKVSDSSNFNPLKSKKDATFYAPHNKVYERRGDEFIPPKILTIRCRMFEKNGRFSNAGQCLTRTEIQVERVTFVGFAEKFTNLVSGEQTALTIKSSSTGKQILTLHLSVGDDEDSNDKVWIGIIPTKKDYIKFCRCKLFLLDSEGTETECGEGGTLLSQIPSGEWKFPLSITKEYLMKESAVFLPNDILSLKCEFAYSTGIHYSHTEFSNLSINTVNPPKIPTALEDFNCMFEEGSLCDAKLQTASETFNVHKFILSARSSVFKSIFTTDMREKTADSVIVEDLEAGTVRRMLLYMYSDTLEDLDWESSKSLYYAADKYNIVALKHRCSEFLKSNLQISNCCELLVLADKHQDEDFKNSVQEYMTLNRDLLLHTDQWKNLEKTDPALVIEIFRTMCLGK